MSKGSHWGLAHLKGQTFSGYANQKELVKDLGSFLQGLSVNPRTGDILQSINFNWSDENGYGANVVWESV